MEQYRFTDDELFLRLKWFVQLRWLFLLVLAALLFCATELFALRLQMLPIVMVAGVVLLYNCAFHLLHRRVSHFHQATPRNLRIEANLQIGLDLLALVLLIHFSGGIENPFIFFFVFHMIVGSILLTGRDIWYQAAVAAGILGLLIGLSWTGVIGRNHIDGFASLELWDNFPYLMAWLASFTATILLAVYLTNSIARSLRTRNKELYSLTSQLENKNEELEEANRELMRQQNLLIQSAKLASLGKLSAGIAHELNTPLTGILNFSHFIKDGCPHEEQIQKDIDIVIRETERCRKIIKGLLDFARQSQPEKKSGNVVAVLNRTIGIVERHQDFRNIELIRQFPDRLPDIVFDGDQIQQVFMNLIVNAQEAMPQGGKLAVTVVHNGLDHTIDIIFADTGPGISEENRQKIFDPFFTTKDMGTGLGLSISLGIIENHGGRLSIHCPAGGGAVFTVQLPVEAEAGIK
jgi:signal transduction histidine kinase